MKITRLPLLVFEFRLQPFIDCFCLRNDSTVSYKTIKIIYLCLWKLQLNYINFIPILYTRNVSKQSSEFCF